jgi:RNA polymerase sigma factor (sigma-70 family)
MMTPPSDNDLLAAYTTRGEEQAFREFVQRHATWVLGVATRCAGQAALGEDITQSVFSLVAQKAAALVASNTVVAAWLHRTTLLTAANAVRGERRYRQRLERAAAELTPMLTMTQEESNLYQEMIPQLDAAMDSLSEADRTLLLLRFFEQRNLAHIARSTGISEDACQKRLRRAVDKLGLSLRRKGVTLSSVMLTSFLADRMTLPASAEMVTHFADTALLTSSGKASLSAYAVAAPLAGASVSVLLTVLVSLVAFAVPVGLQVRANAISLTKTSGTTSVAPVTKATTTLSVSDPILDHLSAALKSLRSDDPEGLLELVLFISDLPLEKMSGAWSIILQHPDEGTIVRALFCRWTELDLQGALAASGLTKNNSLLCSVWHGIASIWAVSDPAAYFAEVAKFPADPNSPLPWQEIANWHGLTKLANARPAAALDYTKHITDSKRQLSVTKMALSLWGQRDPAAAVQHLQTHYQEQALDEMMHLLAEEVAYHRPAVAYEISRQQVNPHYREDEMCFALQQWGADDPKAAAAALAGMEPTMQTSSMAQNVGRTLLRGATEELLEIARKAPPGEFREDLLGTAAMYFHNDEEARSMQQVLEIALLMAPGQHREFNLEHAAKDWLKESPIEARKWLESQTEYPAELKTRFLK